MRSQTMQRLPANAVHALLGAVCDAKRSIEALHLEISECWEDLQHMRLALDNTELELDDLRKAQRKYRPEVVR